MQSSSSFSSFNFIEGSLDSITLASYIPCTVLQTWWPSGFPVRSLRQGSELKLGCTSFLLGSEGAVR
jgi:hypothetical protein